MACSDQLYIGEWVTMQSPYSLVKKMGPQPSALNIQHSTMVVTTCLTVFMLLLVGCGGVDLNCKRYIGTFVSVRGMKGSTIQKQQQDEPTSLIWALESHLESGGGVGTRATHRMYYGYGHTIYGCIWPTQKP